MNYTDLAYGPALSSGSCFDFYVHDQVVVPLKHFNNLSGVPLSSYCVRIQHNNKNVHLHAATLHIPLSSRGELGQGIPLPFSPDRLYDFLTKLESMARILHFPKRFRCCTQQNVVWTK